MIDRLLGLGVESQYCGPTLDNHCTDSGDVRETGSGRGTSFT